MDKTSTHFDTTALSSIELFCRAAELGSFTQAARAVGVTPAAVSRSIGRLEARLGVRLFARSTRQVKLTDDGLSYFEQCRQALDQIVQAERTLLGTKGSPSGVLRVSMPSTYAYYRLLPLLPEFAQRYPQLVVEANVSGRNVDFVDEGFDVAIRLGEPQDSRVVARKLEQAALGVYAAPTYLRARGTPQSLADLSAHDCIQFVLPSTGRGMAWIFKDPASGEQIDFPFTSRLRITEDVMSCVHLARAGGGVFQTFRLIAEAAVARGELVEILSA